MNNKFSKSMSDLKIVLAHDYFTQRGGAERVTLELARALKPQYLLAALYSTEASFPELREFKIRPSIANTFQIFRRDARIALPLLPFLWTMRPRIAADTLVCSSSGWAHGLRAAPGTRKIVYCHNPARWLYQTADYVSDLPWPIRRILDIFRSLLILWDKKAAASADIYIANSTSVARRIRQIYGREAEVIFPPVSIDPTLPQTPIPGLEPPFFLMVGRSRGYKGAQPLVEAFRALPEHKLVIAGGGAVIDAPPNVTTVGHVSDSQLRWLYANARALVSVSREDFGLTPIEANAFGTPALLLRAGGFLDSTNEGVSGLFIEDETIEAIQKAVRAFPRKWDREAILHHAARFSPESFHNAIRRVVLN